VRYVMRSPVSLTGVRFTPGAKGVVYARKGGHDASEPGEDERVDADEFVARVLAQIPDATSCATTERIRTGLGGSAERQRLSSRETAGASLRRLSRRRLSARP
jgi:hypothetical protein